MAWSTLEYSPDARVVLRILLCLDPNEPVKRTRLANAAMLDYRLLQRYRDMLAERGCVRCGGDPPGVLVTPRGIRLREALVEAYKIMIGGVELHRLVKPRR